jgi:CBS domain-containing protein
MRKHTVAEVMTQDVVSVPESAGYREIVEALANREVSAIDLMTAPAVVIGPRDKVTTAAKLMDAEKVKRLPVVDEHGNLVGIVSRGDVLRLFLRTDEDIRREVRDEVLLRTLWIDPDKLTVEVAQGVVTLGGTLDRRSAIGIVVEIVQSVAGVVDVVSHLSYHYDDRKAKSEREPFPIVA